MTGDLTSAALITFRSPSLTAIPVVTVSFPGSNTRRYSIVGAPVQSSLGVFKDRIRDVGDIDYRLSDPRGGLQSVTFQFRLEDIDGDLRSIVDRYGVSSIRGSAVVCDFATGDSTSDWPRLFTGVLDGLDPAPGFEWVISARVDDRPLTDGTWQIPRISSTDYPYALPGVAERPMPVALGLFDSRDGTVAGSVGSVPLYRLNESDGTGGFAYRYLVGAPYFTGVKRVVVGGSTLSTASWVRTYTLRNNLSTSEVWFASDPGASTTVTAEVMGVGDDVSGSPTYLGASGYGAPIINIVSQMRWLLRNYVWSAYRTGSYASDPSAIDTTTWDSAVTWAETRRFRGTFYITEDGQRPGDVFDAFCQWAWIRAGWTRQGKLKLVPFADDDAPYYTDSRWIRYMLRGSEDAYLPSLPRDRTVHTMRSPSWVVPSANASRSIVSVRDARITGNVVGQVDSGLGVARQEFQDGYPGAGNLVLALNASRPGAQGDAVYLSNASALYSWRDFNWSPNSTATDFPNNYRTALTMAASAGLEPTYYAGALNGHSFVRFNGTTQYMDSGGGWTIIPEFTIQCVFRAVTAPAAHGAQANADDAIICDSAGYWGLHLYTSGGLYYLEGYSNDGTNREVSIQISLNTWYVARLRHYGGYLSMSINNWDETRTSIGTFSGSPNKVRLGANYNLTRYAEVDIAAAYIWTAGDRASQGATAGTTYPGLGDNFDTWSALVDRYRM